MASIHTKLNFCYRVAWQAVDLQLDLRIGRGDIVVVVIPDQNLPLRVESAGRDVANGRHGVDIG